MGMLGRAGAPFGKWMWFEIPIVIRQDGGRPVNRVLRNSTASYSSSSNIKVYMGRCLCDVGGLDIKMLPRAAKLEGSRPTGPPPEQDIPLDIPKRTAVYVEQVQ